MKRTLTLYVDGELVEIAKTKGINLSQLFNDILKQQLELPESIKDDTLALQDQIKKLQHDKAIAIQQVNAKDKEIKQLKQQEQKQKIKDEKKYNYEVEF